MNGPTLQVQMLGQFTLRYGDRTISDSDDRSRRVWSLLAYMLYNHGRSFAQEELIHLYWSNGEKSADAVVNAMRALIEQEPLARIDYVSAVDGLTMLPVHEINGGELIAMAVYIGKTRLIDNFSVEG